MVLAQRGYTLTHVGQLSHEIVYGHSSLSGRLADPCSFRDEVRALGRNSHFNWRPGVHPGSARRRIGFPAWRLDITAEGRTVPR